MQRLDAPLSLNSAWIEANTRIIRQCQLSVVDLFRTGIVFAC